MNNLENDNKNKTQEILINEKNLTECNEIINVLKQELSKVKDEIIKNQTEYEKLNTKLTSLPELEKKIKNLEENIKIAQNQYEEEKNKNMELNKINEKNILNLEKLIKEKEEQLQLSEKNNQKILDLENEKIEYKNIIDKNEKIIKEKDEIIQNNTNKINSLEKEIEINKQNSTENYEKIINELKEKLQITNEELLKEKEKVENCIKQKNLIKYLEVSINMIKNELENEKNKNSQIARKLEQYQNNIKNENKKDDTNEPLNQIQNYEKTIIKLNEENNEMKEEIKKNRIIIEKQEKELKEIKECKMKINEIKINLKENYEKSVKEEIEKIKNSIQSNLEKKVKEINEEYKKSYEKREKEFNDKFEKLENQLKNNQKSSISNFPSLSRIDSYINNDNSHNNNFIKENKDNEKEEIKENVPVYSYECLNYHNLKLDVNEGTDEAELEIELKNNGNITWNEDTKLIFVDPSDLKKDEIILNQQKPGEIKTYKIIFKLKNYPPKEYMSNLLFYSGGKPFGEKITININILDKKGMKIKEFRDNFNLSEEEYQDEKVWKILENNNFDFEASFNSLFN